jgi:hypothetical protein
MSRPVQDGAAAAARATLPGSDAPAFDRLVAALLAGPAAPLGAVLRRQLPGTAGTRWLHQEGLALTTRAAALTTDQWLSLYRCWTGLARAPRGGATAPRTSGRPSGAHGHGPGAMAAPRWF